MTGLIAAYSKNRVIGNKGHIPWNIEGEQRRFRELTTENIIIMGRRTYEEIKDKLGGPLPNRITILVSTTTTEKNIEGLLYVAGSFEQALDIACEQSDISGKLRKIYIAGGAELYRQALAVVDTMYITEIDTYVEGDAMFPDFDESLFDKKIEGYHQGDIPYTYVTYVRKRY